MTGQIDVGRLILVLFLIALALAILLDLAGPLPAPTLPSVDWVYAG
jgi:hypothetical protein